MVSGSGQYVIEEVRPNISFQHEAQKRWNEVPAQMGQTNVSAPQLVFSRVSNALSDLEAVTSSINAKSAKWASGGVIGFGINELSNRVDVTLNASTSESMRAATESALVAQYGAHSLEFKYGPIPSLSSSPAADSAPWHGGDEIYGSVNSCTTGPGLHLATGQQLILTAGHCAYESANDGYTPVYYNNGTEVGTESAWWVGGSTSSAAGLDFGVLPTLSADSAWQSNSSLVTFTGYYLPPASASVCHDGFQGDYACGTVVNNSYTGLFGPMAPTGAYEWVNNLLQITGSLIAGDSGGAGWYNTYYGPLITGTNVGTGGGYFYQEEISAELNRLSGYYGVAVTPNVA